MVPYDREAYARMFEADSGLTSADNAGKSDDCTADLSLKLDALITSARAANMLDHDRISHKDFLASLRQKRKAAEEVQLEQIKARVHDI